MIVKKIYENDDKTYYVLSVETENGIFSVNYAYNSDFDAWAILEPKNSKGYKIFTLKKEFKESLKTEILNIIK